MRWRLVWRPVRRGGWLASGDGYGRGYFSWWAFGPLQVRRYED